MDEPIISIKSVEKRFKKQVVLKNFSLDIFKNELFGLVGKSGSGKTTLLRLLLGFYKPEAGEIFMNGHQITKNRRILKQMVGFTTQENSFYKKLTIRENLFYYGRMYGVKNEILSERIDDLLELVDLGDFGDKITEKISGGMKRRVDFAISLIHDPEIVILDEPTTGLDPVLRDNIWNLIKRINKSGKTVIISSHLFDSMEKHCTRVGIMDDGEMVAEGKVKDLMTKFRKSNLHDVFEGLICGSDKTCMNTYEMTKDGEDEGQ